MFAEFTGMFGGIYAIADRIIRNPAVKCFSVHVLMAVEINLS
jgi:hypothetical protein